jgi:DNA primase
MKSLPEIFARYNPKYFQNADEYRMRCPFREKHSPTNQGLTSFVFSAAGGWYHCFSCGSSGRATQLLTGRFFGLKLPDAQELVAVSLLDSLENKKIKKDVFELDEILTVNPPPFFTEDKGIYARILRNFKVGYRYEDYKDKDGYIHENVEHIYIPLFDENDNLLAVKHRIVIDSRPFWYSPAKWDKLSYLYNLKTVLASSKGECVVVEGETDTYKSIQNGVPETTAILGGSLGIEQSRKLRNLKKVKTGFDNDPTGMKYTELWYHLLKPYTDFEVVMYGAKDPGEAKKEDWLYGYRNAIGYGEYSMIMLQEFGDEYAAIQDDIAKRLHKKHLL